MSGFFFGLVGWVRCYILGHFRVVRQKVGVYKTGSGFPLKKKKNLFTKVAMTILAARQEREIGGLASGTPAMLDGAGNLREIRVLLASDNK